MRLRQGGGVGQAQPPISKQGPSAWYNDLEEAIGSPEEEMGSDIA
jgi:hypothetical protein